jgi:hypothetical protein
MRRGTSLRTQVNFSDFISRRSSNPVPTFPEHLRRLDGAIERFRGILHATVKASLRADPPIPDWAAAKVREAWNIEFS